MGVTFLKSHAGKMQAFQKGEMASVYFIQRPVRVLQKTSIKFVSTIVIEEHNLHLRNGIKNNKEDFS